MHYCAQLGLLPRKGFYHYEWIDNIEKLDFEGTQSPVAFHSQLANESALYDDDDDEHDEVNNINYHR